MPRHNGHDAFVDQFFVDSSEGVVPLLAGHIIDTHEKVLVVLFGSIAREMLHTGSHILSSGTLEKCLRIPDGIFRAVVKGPALDNGISPVIEQIYNRCEVPVASDSRAL